MSIHLNLKDYVAKYGTHQIKVIATGEGFRNSEPVINQYVSLPELAVEENEITILNVKKNVSSFDFYVDGTLNQSIEHDIEESDDIVINIESLDLSDGVKHEFYVVAHTSYGDFTSEKAYSTMIFGVSGMYDSNVALTRTDDAIDKSYSIDTQTGIVTSDFDNEFPYSKIEEVTINDNVFISIPAMWFRIGTDEEDNITDIAVAKYRVGEGRWFKTDAFLVGKYLSYQENNVMVSKTGKGTNQNYTATSWTTYAKANGEGYKPYGTYEHTILTFLWLIEFANKRSSNIMPGYSSYNVATGGTDSIEAKTGYLTSNSRMKYRGIEDFVGNEMLWLPDVTGNYYTSRDVNTYTSGITDKTQLSYYQNITSSNSWRGILALGWDDDNPFICLPSKLGSTSATTYFGTSMYGPNNNSSYLPRTKAYPQYNTNCSLSTFVFDLQYTNAQENTSSRLVKYSNLED